MYPVGRIVQDQLLKWVGASTLVPRTPLPYYALRRSIPWVTKDWPPIVQICIASSCYLPLNSSGRRSDTWIRSARTGWASAGSDRSLTQKTSNHSLSTIKMQSDKQTLCNVVFFLCYLHFLYFHKELKTSIRNLLYLWFFHLSFFLLLIYLLKVKHMFEILWIQS